MEPRNTLDYSSVKGDGKSKFREMLHFCAISLLCVLVLGHLYWCVMGIAYWKYATEYEGVGSAVVVSGVCGLLAIPLWMGRAVMMGVFKRDGGVGVESVVGSAAYALAMIGVNRLVPLENWEGNVGWVVVLALLAGGIGAAVGRVVGFRELKAI